MYPENFFSFQHALPFISKKASLPPIGLITISSYLPQGWNKKLIDLNIENLEKTDLSWADMVFISAMYIQQESVREIILKCSNYQLKIIAGGPLFIHEHSKFPEIDHFIQGEAEGIMPAFINDLESGAAEKLYSSSVYPDISSSPVPEYHLLDLDAYAYMNMQVSRGCPYSCDFCEIPSLLGHKVRMKSGLQIISELDALFYAGWKGPVFIVDDNFIGDKSGLKKNLLPAMIGWMDQHKHPFTFYVQTSIDLVDDLELIEMMTDAGINSSFIGIETPSEESLAQAKKNQNKNRDIIADVIKLQKYGIQVSGGFIVGFDSDTEDIFEAQSYLINKGGIVWAMVGLLNAPKGTELYDRLEKEGRLTTEATGSNTDFSMNFLPKMDREVLMNGYRSLLDDIYAVKPYYTRIRQLLVNYRPKSSMKSNFQPYYIRAFLKSVLKLGIMLRGRREFWKLFFWTLFRKPGLLPEAILYIISGYHFRQVYRINKH